jgi:CHAT domain-containing protein
VVRALQAAREEGLQIDVVDCIGWVDAQIDFVLAMILEGEFDVIHFAGHGVFDATDGSKSGWVFGNGKVISAREIFRARRVPKLVFANACFSGVVRGGEALSASELNQANAGLAEAFFERGVQNYLGAGWPVDDQAGVAFALEFYTEILAGSSLGDAISEARGKIYREGNTWGAYQHYGDANSVIVQRARGEGRPAPGSHPKPAEIKASTALRSKKPKRHARQGAKKNGK